MILSSAGGVKSQNNNLTAFQQIEVGNLRRTDLLLYGMGENATNLHTDASTGHPCSRSHIDQACRIPGHTLQKINTLPGTATNAWQSETASCSAFETFGNTTSLDAYRTWSVKRQKSNQSPSLDCYLAGKDECQPLFREKMLYLF